MPTYLLLTKLTPEGRQRIAQQPERLEQVNLEVNDFGCKIVGQYAVMGQYDFLTVIEAPDNETIAHLSVDLGSRGTIHITSLPAIPIDQFIEKLKEPIHMGKK